MTYTVPRQSAVDPRLTKYMVSHSQYANTMTRQGTLGFRAVGITTTQPVERAAGPGDDTREAEDRQ